MAKEQSDKMTNKEDAYKHTVGGLKVGWWLVVALYLLLALFITLAFFFPPFGAFFGLSMAVVAAIGQAMLGNLAVSLLAGFAVLGARPNTVEEGLFTGSAVGLGMVVVGAGV